MTHAITPTPPPSAIHPGVIDDLCATARETPPGCFVEVGVFRGGSAWHLAMLAKEQGRLFFGYDTFEGIPCFTHGIDAHYFGDFGPAQGQSYEQVCADVPYGKFIKGVFPGSLIEMGPVAFVHLDVDQYESYKQGIPALVPLMVPGGVMWFDDCEIIEGATRAVHEAFDNSRLMTSKTRRRYVKM